MRVLIKIDLPCFNRHLHVESFLDWLLELENFFDYMQIPEAQQVKLVAHQGKQPVHVWPKMKRLMRAQFLPPNYEQLLYQTINEYTEESYHLNFQNNLSETKGQQVARYIGGLRVAIQDKVTLHTVWTLSEAVNLAMKIELQLTRPPASRDQRTQNNYQVPKANTILTGNRGSTSQNPYSKCPMRKSINMVDGDDSAKVNDNESEEEDDFVEGDASDLVNCVIQQLLLTPKHEDHTQRHVIFKTHCIINHKVCNLIIDSKSCENIVPRAPVSTLQLNTEKHPKPYKISWIKRGAETKMDACHVLLGRMWQYKVDATYKGRDNT
ncbi:hypothetical protein I3843_09G040300 [Carya illinoinensis]|nr:hypothetical protein I3843_09G040300 [Carya illinoinensis]